MAGFGEFVKSGLSGLVGNITKAQIIIEDYRKYFNGSEELKREDPVAKAAANGMSMGISDMKAMKALPSQAKALAAQSDAFGAAAAAAGYGNDVEKRVFEVLFNPSELRLQAYGGKFDRAASYNTQDNKSETTVEPTLILSVPLIFDKVDPQGAFSTLDTLSNLANPTNLLQFGAKNVVGLAKGGKDTSVQKEVEGLIGALQSYYTRWVTFSWGQLVYEGIFNSCQGRYTMFDSKGIPIHAEVNLSILLFDNDAAEDGSWVRFYDGAYGDAVGGVKSYVSKSQLVGNLLNI